MKIFRDFSREINRQGFFLSIVLILVLCVFRQAASQEAELTKEKIVQAAMDAFEKKHGKLQERVILYDIENGKWQEKFKLINKEMAQKFAVLAGKNYQAICFSIKPKFGLKGQNTWVFVDKLSGKVLALYVE